MTWAKRWARANAGPIELVGLRPKDHSTHNAPFFSRLEYRTLLVGEKYYALGPLVCQIGDNQFAYVPMRLNHMTFW